MVENPVIMFTPNMVATSTDDGTVTGNILFKTYSFPENTQNVGEITVSTLEGGRTIAGFEIATENSDKGFVHAGKLYELVGTGNTRTLQFKQDFVPDFENPINDNGIAEAGENQGCWLRLKVTDSGNTITQLDIRIEIKDVNEAARGVQMYVIGVSNNLLGGSIVGVLSAVDDATGNGDYTYTLVDAVDTANSADNNLFEIDGATLKFKASTSVSSRVKDYRISIQVAEAGFSKTAIEEFRITPYEKIFDVSEQVFWFAADSYDIIPADDANVEEIVTRQDGSSRKTLVKLGDNDGDGNAKFKVNSFNFNPALEFENDEFVGSVGIRGSDARSYYVVASNSEATNNWRYVLGMGGASGNGFDIGKVGTFGSDNGKLILTYNGRDSDIRTSDVVWAVDKATFAYAGYSRNNEGKISVNGGDIQKTNGKPGYGYSTTDRFLIGTGSKTGENEDWKGKIAEIIVFNKELTDIERKKIESYLSIKYGIAKATGDYIDGYGDVVRSVDADYTSGINALAKDSNSKLHQRISGGTRGIVVSTDANFERANIAGDEGHTDIAGNKAFLFWADNNLDLVSHPPKNKFNSF